MYKFFGPFLIGFTGLALVASCSVCDADWQGTVTIKIGSPSGPQVTITGKGTLHHHGSQERIDMLMASRSVVTITDFAKGTEWGLLPKFHVAFAKGGDLVPRADRCNPAEIETCYKRQNRIGSATFDGHPCTLYEQTTHGMVIKNWRPNDLKDVFALKSTISKGDREIMDFEVSDIEHEPQQESLFSVPKGYTFLERHSVKIRKMPNAAMLPTLHYGDEFLIETRAYKNSEPQRGDIVVWKDSPSDKDLHISRIFAMPRERVEFHDNSYFVSGRQVQEKPLSESACEKLVGMNAQQMRGIVCDEENVEGFRHLVLKSEYSTSTSKSGPLEIWEGSYYILPDSRLYDQQVSDSNVIKHEQIFGKVLLPQE